jgi:hydrogenase maturation factor HypF (carbamoyltransferase family)
MAASKSAIEIFSFDGEDVGAIGAASLRGLPRLSEIAPLGRMFDAIASMADVSEQAALEFEAAGRAELDAERDASESHLQRGMRLAHRLRHALGAELPTQLPTLFRKTH